MVLRTLVLAFVLGLTLPVSAQNAPPRIGAGIDMLAIPLRGGEQGASVGIGLRGRLALPINADLSGAASLGVSTDITGDGGVTATPQVSLIVTLPRSGRSVRYLIGGFGGFVPLSGGGAGPTIHAGFGWAAPLSETSIYFEIDPALVVGSEELSLLVPVRVGVIF